MIVLGLNIFHGDAAACIIKDGKIVVAIEEERINRIKHSSGFPINSINYCLNYSNLKISDVNYVCINRNPKVNLLKKIIFVIKNKLNYSYLLDRYKNLQNIASVKDIISEYFDKEKINFKVINIEHHLSHISSAFHLSGFKSSSVLSIDGFGDFVSTMWGKANKKKIDIKESVYFPHSLGIFYTAITQHLGFPNYGDEYKLMGLSSYGKDSQVKKIYQIFDDVGHKFKLKLKYFNHTDKKFNLDFYDEIPIIGTLFNEKVIEVLGKPREAKEELTQYHKDLAKSAQVVYEEIFYKILNNLYDFTKNENLCLSGGCAQNSVANGKILKKTRFKNIYVSSSSGDSGGAIGAATYFLSQKNIFLNKEEGSFYGPNFTKKQIQQSIYNNKKDLQNVKQIDFESEEKLLDLVCAEILNKKIVGWFQGKMEWGPRALGNRSIIANPAISNIKDIINSKIKRRESFRPFAPSILEEYVDDWFDSSHESLFMSFVNEVKANKRDLIPSVVHTDGTGRLQTVSKKTNLKFYNLIKNFHKISGIPLLLNTSFNENEPIVMTPEHAISCFVRTKMDLLVLENTVLIRN
jgi:carbamoyltransferase